MKRNDIFRRFAAWFSGKENIDDGIEQQTDDAFLAQDGYEYHRRHEKLMRLLEERPEENVRLFEIRSFKKTYTVLSVLVCAVLAGVLLYAVSFMPRFGSADNPANNEVADKYLEDGLEDTGAVSAVAGMILDYRAFDTLGESFVLFTAVCCVMILLGREDGRPSEKCECYEGENDQILHRLVRVLVPATMLFGCYIILNGHLSPGGGFAGGAIIGAAMMLWCVSLGFRSTERFFSGRTFRAVTFAALTFYCVSKTYSFYTGANGIESVIPLGTPGAILSSGLIMPLNVAVGMVVSCTMFGFFSLFMRSKI